MVEPRRDLKQKRFPSIFKCCRSKKNNLPDNPYPTVRTMDFETLEFWPFGDFILKDPLKFNYDQDPTDGSVRCTVLIIPN